MVSLARPVLIIAAVGAGIGFVVAVVAIPAGSALGS
jgi:hypothetical protein